jgi:hypothetical protein
MIGAAYSQSVGGNVTADYAVDITPSSLIVEAQNGGYQSPLIRANPVNGVGPYDFTWTTSTPLISLDNVISSGLTANTRITTSGFAPDLIEGVLTCNCIDTGNGNALTQSSINFSIQFV